MVKISGNNNTVSFGEKVKNYCQEHPYKAAAIAATVVATAGTVSYVGFKGLQAAYRAFVEESIICTNIKCTSGFVPRMQNATSVGYDAVKETVVNMAGGVGNAASTAANTVINTAAAFRNAVSSTTKRAFGSVFCHQTVSPDCAKFAERLNAQGYPETVVVENNCSYKC